MARARARCCSTSTVFSPIAAAARLISTITELEARAAERLQSDDAEVVPGPEQGYARDGEDLETRAAGDGHVSPGQSVR